MNKQTKRNLYMDKGITGTASKFVYGAVSEYLSLLKYTNPHFQSL